MTCETKMENPTIEKMLKNRMLKSGDFQNVLITVNPCFHTYTMFNIFFPGVTEYEYNTEVKAQGAV